MARQRFKRNRVDPEDCCPICGAFAGGVAIRMNTHVCDPAKLRRIDRVHRDLSGPNIAPPSYEARLEDGFAQMNGEDD